MAEVMGHTLDLELRHTRGLQVMSRLISSHSRGRKTCPLCDQVNLATSVLEHVLEQHMDRLDLNEMTALQKCNNRALCWALSMNL